MRKTSSRRLVPSTPRNVVMVNDIAEPITITPTTIAIMISIRVMP